MRCANRKLSVAAIFVIVAAASLATVNIGFTRVNGQEPTDASPRTRAILAKLEKHVPMQFIVETPLDDLFKYVRRATIGDGDDELELPIYLDPIGFQELKRSVSSKFILHAEDTPLRITLAQALAQAGLAYTVQDDVIMISSPEGLERERFDTQYLPRLHTPQTKKVLAHLEAPVAMEFEADTPLEDVLKYITQATTTADARGITFVVDAIGLQEVDKTLRSTVSINLEGVPLRKSLRLLLGQLGLAYTVKDGLAIISSRAIIRKMFES